MVARQSTYLRRLAGGRRGGVVGFSPLPANPRVTVAALVEGWGAEITKVCADRHVLSIRDTSGSNFGTTREHDRGRGEFGKSLPLQRRSVGRGVLLHAVLGLDAKTDGIVGLVSGQVWTRRGRVITPHRQRALSEKETHPG